MYDYTNLRITNLYEYANNGLLASCQIKAIFVVFVY